MKTLYITICIFYYCTTGSFMHENIKDNAETLNKQIGDNSNDTEAKQIGEEHYDIGKQLDDTSNETQIMFNKTNAELKGEPFQYEKKNNNISRTVFEPSVATEHPWLQRRTEDRIPYRRQYKYKDMASDESERESSTSSEMQHWREEFDLDWVNKKMSAIKEKINTTGAITINMAGGRPWGIPCGDPNEHDQPWGSCVLPYECDGEFRIYRGDTTCGRSKFVCCALQVTHHDLYQAIDMSFIDTSVSTSSNERNKKIIGSKEIKHRKKLREIYRRRQRRLRLKRNIKKLIRKLARQIRKSLNRAFRNATGDRRQKTKMLKNEIKNMKKRFYLDRKVAKNIHDFDVQKIDQDLKFKLKHIRQLNHEFMMNDTFRELILQHNSTGLRMLLSPFPGPEDDMIEKINMLAANSTNSFRRSGGHKVHKKKKRKRKRKDYLEYDIEYGALYY